MSGARLDMPGSGGDMDIGARLRDAREAKGLSVDSLAARTRVAPRMLSAIERNDLSTVPPRPYGRGFVRAYAQEVGLDPDTTVRAYFARFEPVAPAQTRHVSGERVGVADDAPWWPTRVPVAAPAVALLILVTVLTLWARRPDAPPATPAPAPVGTSGNVQPAAVPGATAGAAAAGPTDPAASTDLIVILEADQPAWVTATADGKRVIYKTLPPATRETIRARREMRILVGNAGAVRWTVGRREPATMGPKGAVRSVTVTRENASTIR
ncbi:MAG: helix-turn-helix domain-containing protein [Acidobacteria bacterium]|nr:helix-turn-helix domain-containing protein [Acidobacteriota bacterium]MCA1649584.1 helix-turn-helix domain-containing protein [Acidobacteriota bacterium]